MAWRPIPPNNSPAFRATVPKDDSQMPLGGIATVLTGKEFILSGPDRPIVVEAARAALLTAI